VIFFLLFSFSRLRAQASSTRLGNPPSPKWQRLQFQSRRLDEPPERDDADDHADDVHDIVAIGGDVAYATSLDTAILLGREGA